MQPKEFDYINLFWVQPSFSPGERFSNLFQIDLYTFIYLCLSYSNLCYILLIVQFVYIYSVPLFAAIFDKIFWESNWIES